jgi:hypothetical protein
MTKEKLLRNKADKNLASCKTYEPNCIHHNESRLTLRFTSHSTQALVITLTRYSLHTHTYSYLL